jgi:hypothetical protein
MDLSPFCLQMKHLNPLALIHIAVLFLCYYAKLRAYLVWAGQLITEK